jgi:hypothetical protein
MVAKLAVIIIAIGAAFGALLVNRQQRIDAVAEIARSQLRMEMHDKTIMRLQAAVAHAIRPDELRVAAFAACPSNGSRSPIASIPSSSPTSGPETRRRRRGDHRPQQPAQALSGP